MSLKIGVIPEGLPTISQCALDKKCPQRGTDIDSTRFICESFNLNCTLIWYDRVNVDYGDVLENGTATGFIGAIQRGEFDTSTPSFTQSFNRIKVIDFSEMFTVTDHIIMARMPEPINPGVIDFRHILNFQTEVWILLFVTFLFVVCISIFILRKIKLIFDPVEHLKTNASGIFDLGASLITYDFKKRLLKFRSIRIIVIFWMFGGMILTGSYTGILFSQQFATIRMPFRDLETFIACLERDECQIATPSTTRSVFLQLSTSGTDLGHRFAHSLLKNPMKIMPAAEIHRAILREKEKYLVSIGSKNSRLYWADGNQDCKYFIVDLGTYQINAFPLAKNSPWLKKLNKAIKLTKDFGLQYAPERNYRVNDMCDKRRKNLFKKVQFRGYMSTTFLFYFGGLAICCIVCIIEIIIYQDDYPITKL